VLLICFLVQSVNMDAGAPVLTAVSFQSNILRPREAVSKWQGEAGSNCGSPEG
jgi:hypothetical protein